MTSPRTRARRAAGALSLALCCLALAAAPRAAGAQSKSDVFAGRIPPVSGQLYRKDGRLELSLSGNLSVNDAFYSKYFGGLKVGYHLTEFLSLSAQAQLGTTGRAGSAVTCSATGCQDAGDSSLWQVPGELKRVVGLEAAWSPVYGKLNVASEQVIHFDLSLLVGADWIGYREVVSAQQAEALRAGGGEPGDVSTVGGHVGLGVRVFFAEWIAARLELKDYVYRVPVPDPQADGATRQDWQNQLFTEMGISIFFPLTNRP